MDISFNSGISSISRTTNDHNNDSFPENKSALKPPGTNIIAHVWKALQMDHTFQNVEKNFAMEVFSPSLSLSPEEHYYMTESAIQLFEKNQQASDKFKKALEVLQGSKQLQEALMISRNVLIAG